jgi:hypothetical protein
MSLSSELNKALFLFLLRNRTIFHWTVLCIIYWDLLLNTLMNMMSKSIRPAVFKSSNLLLEVDNRYKFSQNRYCGLATESFPANVAISLKEKVVLLFNKGVFYSNMWLYGGEVSNEVYLNKCWNSKCLISKQIIFSVNLKWLWTNL